jgi:hypothetical protein
MPLTSPRWQHFAQTIHDAHSSMPQQAAYEFKIANCGRELLQAFGLLYREYLHAGYVRENEAELLFTRHHLLPETTVFVAKRQSTVLSTATVVRDSPDFGLPMDDLYASELGRLRREGRRILEICSLASDRHEFSRGGIQDFTRLLFLFSLNFNVDDVCIMVNPKHASLYTSRCEFEILGDEKHYSRVKAPAIALRADACAMRERLRSKAFATGASRTPFQKNASTRFTLCDTVLGILQNGQTPPRLNPLSASMVQTLLSTADPSVHALPPEYVSFLQNEYPGLKI